MSFYERKILPHLINKACGAKPITYQRKKVVPNCEGTVLEIGIGTGHNLPFYDPAKVKRVIGLDPSEESWEIARRNHPDLPFELEFIGLPGEEIPLEDKAVDTVLVTYSLCTIPDPVKAVEGMRRVLKPGGKMIFCEHGLAPDADVVKWQRRLDPIWKRIAGGCHLTRNIPEIINEGGFKVEGLETMYVPSTARFAGFNYWGEARPH